MNYSVQEDAVIVADETPPLPPMNRKEIVVDDVSSTSSDEDYDNDSSCLSCDREEKLKCLFLGCGALSLYLIWLFNCSGYKAAANALNGNYSPDFQRRLITPRPDRLQQLNKYNMYYGDDIALEWSGCENDVYWHEEGMASISSKAEAEILKAAFEVHNMALEAVDLVVNDPVLLYMFNIHPNLREAVKKSWKERQTDLQGRFDFSWSLKT